MYHSVISCLSFDSFCGVETVLYVVIQETTLIFRAHQHEYLLFLWEDSSMLVKTKDFSLVFELSV